MLLVCQILSARRHGDREGIFGPMPTAILVAGVWALNPVQASAVTYLVQRMTSLSSLFFILSMALFIMGRRRALEKKACDYITITLCLGSAVTTGLALLCKENSAMIPVMMVLTEWWFFQPDLFQRVKGFCRRHPVGCAMLGLLASAWAYKVLMGLLAGFEGRHFTALERLMTEARIVVWYISALLWPAPGRLSLEHHVELSTSLIHPITTVISIVFLLGLSCWVFWRRTRFPVVTYGMLWFLVNLVIESTIVPLELLFEHRMYLPSLGLFLALGDGLLRWVSGVGMAVQRREAVVLTWCCFALIASMLSLATYSRNTVWESFVSQSADDARKHPESPRARANHALALSRAGRFQEAIEEARVAMGLGRRHYEEYGVAANTMMIAYSKMGEATRIIEEAPAILEAWPPDADVYTRPSIWMHLASAQHDLGDLEAAYKSLQNALFFNLKMSMQIPNFEKLCSDRLTSLFRSAREKGVVLEGMEAVGSKGLGAEFWSATLLLQAGYLTAGAEMMKRLASVDEAHAGASREILAKIDENSRLNGLQASKWSFVKKYVRNPSSRFNACMAIAYLVREHKLPGPFSTLGEKCLDYALALHPDSSDAHLLKGWYHFERNQVSDALMAAHRAIELDPDYAKAWMGLGFFLTKGPQPTEAVSAFSRALQLYPGYPQRSSIIGIINSLQNDA